MEDFIAKVAEMRRLQKKYFKSRDPHALQAAKKAENEVDAFLSNGQTTEKKQVPDELQPSLF